MGASNKICTNCGRKMKQQFIGLQHCKCGVSWKKGAGFFERSRRENRTKGSALEGALVKSKTRVFISLPDIPLAARRMVPHGSRQSRTA